MFSQIRKYAGILLLGLTCSGLAAQSLFNPNQYRDLTADRKAYRVGDTLTVLIVQQVSAEARAGTRAQRNTDLSANYRDTAQPHNIDLGISASRKGDASTRRDGFVNATLTATVTAIDSIGRLRVSGNQEVIVNGEEQRISVAGFVRPDDIRADNTVLSPRLAEARVEISGDGNVSDVQAKGLIAKILGWLGLL